MTKYILADAIGNINDRYLLESAFFVLNNNHRVQKTLIKLIAACMACFVCAIGIIKIFQISYYRPKTNTEYYSIQSIKIFDENNKLSRSGILTPLTPDCQERKMTKSELKKFFQSSDYNLFKNQISDCRLILNGDKTTHTVKMNWYFDDGTVYAVFDPKTYPKFIFDSKSSIKSKFYGYDIAIQKTKNSNSDFELDIGIKNEKMGVWIFGNEKCKDEMEVLMNYIFNHPISFELK